MGIGRGRVVTVRGAGRGMGREHALELARQGAKVVVNDPGATPAGEGHDASPAQEVVEAIRKGGGEAPRHRRVGDPETAGCLAEGARGGHREEGPHVVPVHGRILAQAGGFAGRAGRA